VNGGRNSNGQPEQREGGGPGASPFAQVIAAARWSRRAGGLQLGHWWAGASLRRARRKTGDVIRRGPDVWRDEGGPTLPEDDAPPWGGAPVTAANLAPVALDPQGVA